MNRYLQPAAGQEKAPVTAGRSERRGPGDYISGVGGGGGDLGPGRSVAGTS